MCLRSICSENFAQSLLSILPSKQECVVTTISCLVIATLSSTSISALVIPCYAGYKWFTRDAFNTDSVQLSTAAAFKETFSQYIESTNQMDMDNRYDILEDVTQSAQEEIVQLDNLVEHQNHNIHQIPEPKSRTTLTITNRKVREDIAKLFTSENVGIDLWSPFGDESLWCRDHQVVRLDGSHLIPYYFEDSYFVTKQEIGQLVHKMFSSYVNQYVAFGQKLDSEQHSVLANGAPLFFASTCIEGGNVYFLKLDKRQLVIIGMGSIFLSMGALRAQGYLTKERINAKRVAMFKSIDDIPDKKFIEACRHFEDTQEGLIQEAQNIAAEFALVEEMIAEELQISKNNLIVIEHNFQHIDLEILVLDDGVVLHHDPQLAIEVLTELRRKASPTNELEEFIISELQRQESSNKSGVFLRNKRILENAGLEVIGIAGLYLNGKESGGGQLLNGLRLNGGHRNFLISTALISTISEKESPILFSGYPESHRISESFYDKMRELGVDVIFISSSSFLGGGVHCSVKETRDNWNMGEPQRIPIDVQFLAQKILTPIKLNYDLKRLPSESYKFIARMIDSTDLTAEEIEAIEIDHLSERYSTFNLSVPLDGLKIRLGFRLKKELVWSESEVRRVLPGHPQIVNLGEILLAGRNSAVIEQDPSTILSIPS